MLRLFAAQGNGVAEHPVFDRIAADRGTGKLHLGAFYETHHHQPLNVRVCAVDAVDDVFATTFERCKGHEKFISVSLFISPSLH